MYGSQTAGRMHRGLSQLDIDTFCARNPATGGFSAPCTGDGGCDVNLKCLVQPTTNGTYEDQREWLTLDVEVHQWRPWQ